MLTIVTQTGGIILLACIPLFLFLKRRIEHKWSRRIAYIFSFTGVYVILTFTLVPMLATIFGRVPLPLWNHDGIRPLNTMTCLLNRQYVTKELAHSLNDISIQFRAQYPNAIISYLDANFPFVNGYPLFPHLSHDDGKKVDFAFFYKDQDGNPVKNQAPSLIGYGVTVDPHEHETNMPQTCSSIGYWQYSALDKLVPQWNKPFYSFDEQKTKYLIELLSRLPEAEKVFIEPHIKERLELDHPKIRFHGCHAVRHDDHIHYQIK